MKANNHRKASSSRKTTTRKVTKRKAGKRHYKPGRYERVYKGKKYTLVVAADGVTFRGNGKQYASPGAYSKEITRDLKRPVTNGPGFFGMK